MRENALHKNPILPLDPVRRYTVQTDFEGVSVKRAALVFLFGVFLFAAMHLGAAAADFSGTWEFSPAKSKNTGMMAQMKSVSTIRQSAAEMVISNVTFFNGEESKLENRFDLTGKATENETPMGAKEQTTSHWDGSKLITTWTGKGSVAGTTTTRTETRYLSGDGKTLIVESSRRSGPPLMMVYERK